MRKILTTGAAALFMAMSVAVSTAPASAGGISFGFGGGYDDDWYDYDDDYGGGIYVELDADDFEVDDDYDTSDSHEEWCEAHYKTYDADTNMYFYKPGKKAECDSPFD